MKIMHMLGVLVLVAALALLALGGVGYNGQRGLLDAIAAQVISPTRCATTCRRT